MKSNLIKKSVIATTLGLAFVAGCCRNYQNTESKGKQLDSKIKDINEQKNESPYDTWLKDYLSIPNWKRRPL